MQLPQNLPATWYFFFLLVSVFAVLHWPVLLHFLNSSQEYSLSTCFVSRYNGKNNYSLFLNSHKHVKIVQKRLYLDKDFNFFIIITTSAAICCNSLALVKIMYIMYVCLSRVLSSFIL